MSIIQVENISKRYIISHKSGQRSKYNSLGETISNKFRDLFLSTKDSKQSTKNKKEKFWALKNISFEVNKGDKIGIIGRNGAGKSTMLKILSRITEPTEGRVKIKGRVASLLEVGTGFHPELTGRENIFLNGAILGMKKDEIKKKFDEIVAFSEIEKFLDTPVKRYSSGMYVRLAFAVAAHLEPEILLVDEVLAVGDYEFQKKCLGKMEDVSKAGRTVLFVSHNMDAISRLCHKTFLFESAKIIYQGDTHLALKKYYKYDDISTGIITYDEKKAPGNDFVNIISIRVISVSKETINKIYIEKDFGIEITYRVKKTYRSFTHGINIFDQKGIHILTSHDYITAKTRQNVDTGIYKAIAWINGNILADGFYTVSVALMSYNPFEVILHEKDTVSFSILDHFSEDTARGTLYGGYLPGLVRPKLKWECYNKKAL